MGPSIAFALPLALVSMLAMAGSNSTTLPNGAALTVSIDDPVTSTEFEVPPGQPNIDVAVTGTASVGLGEADATFVYVMDLSGSTDEGGGTGCAPILACEKIFFNALNAAVVADGSVDQVGIAVYGDNGATADMAPALGPQLLIDPGAPGAPPLQVNTVVNSAFSQNGGAGGGLTQFSARNVGVQTNCTAGLQQALLLVNASTNGTNNVVFASDGVCNTGGPIAPAVAALQASGAIVNSVAIGSGSSCDNNTFGLGTLRQMAVNGGQCFQVPNPGNLPDIIDNLIGSTLESLEIAVDGGAQQPIPNTDITPDLPQPGAASVNYTTPANDLAPGDRTICVTANGSDVTGGVADVTQCETIHLLQLSAAPPEATNELGSDHQHTVTATIAGPASHIVGRTVGFAVTGQNAGATGTCNPASCTTDASGNVSFTYSVPVAPSSLGTDTITVSTTIAEPPATAIALIKHWVDTTPPVAACPPGPNPGGHIPRANNQDGFFRLLATDDVDPDADIFVRDSGSGTTWGPFPSGTTIKYTEAPGTTPSIRPGSGAVNWVIRGTGDAEVYAVDGSGNQSATVSCLVPPPPSRFPSRSGK